MSRQIEALSAKTVGELRKVTAWPDNLVITTPQERHSERTIRISKATHATRVTPKSKNQARLGSIYRHGRSMIAVLLALQLACVSQRSRLLRAF